MASFRQRLRRLSSFDRNPRKSLVSAVFVLPAACSLIQVSNNLSSSSIRSDGFFSVVVNSCCFAGGATAMTAATLGGVGDGVGGPTKLSLETLLYLLLLPLSLNDGYE